MEKFRWGESHTKYGILMLHKRHVVKRQGGGGVKRHSSGVKHVPKGVKKNLGGV